MFSIIATFLIMKDKICVEVLIFSMILDFLLMSLAFLGISGK